MYHENSYWRTIKFLIDKSIILKFSVKIWKTLLSYGQTEKMTDPKLNGLHAYSTPLEALIVWSSWRAVVRGPNS